MDIRKLPAGLKELTFKRRTEYFEEHTAYKDTTFTLMNSFGWGKTIEGIGFWSNINRGDFECYYKIYKKKIDNFSII